MQKNSITVLTNTTVKAIVTDRLKESTHRALVAKHREMEQQLERLLLQKQYFASKYQNDSEQLNSAQLRFDKVEQEIKAKLAQYQSQLQQVVKWEIGSEIIQTQMQSLTEINEGDLFPAASKEVIVKDGVVVEIRKTRGSSLG